MSDDSNKTSEEMADEICANWFKFEKSLPANVLRIWIIEAINAGREQGRRDLEKKLEIAGKALEFYAEPMAWEELPYGDGTTYGTQVLMDVSNISKTEECNWSPGKTAREALREIEENENE